RSLRPIPIGITAFTLLREAEADIAHAKDGTEILDCLHVMETGMRYFFMRAQAAGNVKGNEAVVRHAWTPKTSARSFRRIRSVLRRRWGALAASWRTSGRLHDWCPTGQPGRHKSGSQYSLARQRRSPVVTTRRQ